MGNPYSTTRSRSLRDARRAGLRIHKVTKLDHEAKGRGGDVAGTNLKITISQPMESARHAQKIAILHATHTCQVSINELIV